MNVYLFATVLGLLGLVLMAVLGGLHAAGGGHAHGHAGHTSGHSGAGGSAHHGHNGLRDLHHGAGHGPSAGGAAWLLTLASPRVLLSLALGFGLTGLLLAHLLPGVLLLAAALLGGFLFEALLMRPYWSFLLRFESRPALTLASVSGGLAQAATDFDARGAGLISFELNGETRQMLAHLNTAVADPSVPQAQSVVVRRGETLTIESIDEPSNRCTVRRN
ncbi:hypothetical protein Q0M94_20640 (plasmid) [Deinococcus radiomollis]|uniref:hypothetical protein n=1 Tax=Deinococcus radiomollis TaxID=468916 RepID=UPI003891ECB6